MEVIKTAIEGLVIIEPKVFGDARGYFFESFSQREFEEKVLSLYRHVLYTLINQNAMLEGINQNG